MQLADLWSSATKFVECDARDRRLGAALLDAGFPRFLAVVGSPQRRDAIARQRPDLAAHVTVSRNRRTVRNNNADVLILSGRAAWSCWSFRDLRHARDIMWRPRLGLSTIVAALGCLVNLVLGRLGWAGVLHCGELHWLVFHVRRRQPRTDARHYVPHRLAVRGVLEGLSAAEVRYIVLRWFERLPELPPGEDLDLLVDDGNLDTVLALLDDGPGIQPCDVYTVTGLPGTDYRRMPYFPPYVAAAMLDEAQPHPEVGRIPSLRHQFLSQAYHALYHKGARSGLPSRRPTHSPVERPEHDYAAVLGQLAGRLGLDVPLTLEDLDTYLDQQGWRPPHDMLVRLGGRKRKLPQFVSHAPANSEDSGLAVFVVREEALRRGGIDRMLGLIENQGFHVLRTKLLSSEESRMVARSIRGGNWGRGPWGVCGGLPAAAVVVYDSEPMPVSARQRKRFPHVTNGRLLLKSKIRDAFNQGYPAEQACNVLHSSDNGREALEYIRIIMPEATAEIQAQVQNVQPTCISAQPVLQTLTRHGRRAKIEVIDVAGRPVVKKTFKPHQQRFCRREAEAMRVLSRSIPEIPTLLVEEPDAVIYPYYDDVLRYQQSSGMLLPLGVARRAIAVLQKVYEAGYALIDAHPANLIVDRTEGLKLIDFEFLYRYRQQPECFEQSYDVAGCPEDFTDDMPAGGSKGYARHWQPYVGLSLESLLHDPPWLQHMKRTVYRIVHLPRLLPRWIRHGYRCALQALQFKTIDPMPVVAAPDRGPAKLTRQAA